MDIPKNTGIFYFILKNKVYTKKIMENEVKK